MGDESDGAAARAPGAHTSAAADSPKSSASSQSVSGFWEGFVFFIS